MEFDWNKFLKAFLEALAGMVSIFINVIPLAFILSGKISSWFSLIYIITIPVAYGFYNNYTE